VISVSYKELTANPLEILKTIYGQMEYDWTDQMDKSVKQYIKENPQNRRGKHKYKNDLQEAAIPQNIVAYANYFNELL
jgi:hypothetical protein